jgi:xylulokinase
VAAGQAVFGIDIGTSSTKAVLVALDGTVLRTATREHPVDRPHPGHVEMDAEIWWDELTSLAEELTGGEHEIVAVGVSGMGPCVLLLDGEGRPVRPAILYGVDARAGDQIAALEEGLGAEAIYDRTGTALSSQAAGPKILWVAGHEPEQYRRARRLLMPASYLALRLTGAYVLDHHSASQCTPMYDPRAHDWIEEWAELCAPGLELPKLLWPGEVAGRTTAALAGIPAGVPVVAGTIDAWTEAVSVGAQRPGDLFLMYGTTMFLICTTETAVSHPAMWSTVGAFPGTHCLAGGMATSGAITAWLRDLTGGVDYPTLIAEAAASPPGANGLLVLPYFAGERTPVQDPDARGAVLGLTLSHTRGDLYRATLEATALGVRHNVEVMRDAGARIDRVVAAGGGTQGDLWPQIVSDVTGLTQVLPRETVGASLGAAHLAAAAVADVDIDDWNPPRTTIEPDAAATARYDTLYDLYRAAYPATAEISHALAGMQREET